jgi:hypothetical protein
VHLVIILAVGLGASALFGYCALSTGLAAPFDHWMYLPFMAKPVPTPTLTPTATPLPPMVDVRVEGEDTCSRFRGGSRHDPNGEYVCLRNYDVQSADMTGWRVEDASSHSYSFPAFALKPGAIVRLHSGPGTDTATDLHWGRGLVWNNDHDTVYLYDAFGRLVSRHVY